MEKRYRLIGKALNSLKLSHKSKAYILDDSVYKVNNFFEMLMI